MANVFAQIEKLDARSEHNLHGVRKELRAFFLDHIYPEARKLGWVAVVVEGIRSPTRQAALVRSGASLTVHSHHLDGRAIDVAIFLGDGVEVTYRPQPYIEVAAKVREAAAAAGVTWGGNWKQFRDYMHWQVE